MNRVLFSVAVLVSASMYAGGFRVSLQGVRQLAMAHTSAHTEDASVTFFNPAGMAFIPNRLSVVAGGFGVKSEVEYQNPNTLETVHTDNALSTPLYGAATYKVVDNVSLGVSFTTPYGSSLNWGKSWSGRDIVQEIKLRSFFIQPMVSVKLTDWMSIGGGYIFATGSVDWSKSITGLDGSLNLQGKNARGQGYTLGTYFRPHKDLDISFSYRSRVDMKVEGAQASFSDVSPVLLSRIGIKGGTTDTFSATLPLAREVNFGLSYRVTPRWMMSYDFNLQGWGDYQSLSLDFHQAQVGTGIDPTIQTTEKNFKNSKIFRAGTQYMLTDNFAARLGYIFDEKVYGPDYFTPETPSFDVHSVTGGFGYRIGGFGIDAAVSYSIPEARTFSNPIYNFAGQARAKAFTFGLGLSYNAF